MKSRNVGIFLFILLLVLVIVFNRGDVSLTGQDHFELKPLSSAGYSLESEIHLYNPNYLSCTIKSIHEEFRLHGILLGILDQEINQGIPGRKESSFPVSVRFARRDYEQARGDSVGADSLNLIEVEGEVVYTNLVNGGKVRVHQNSNLN